MPKSIIEVCCYYNDPSEGFYLMIRGHPQSKSCWIRSQKAWGDGSLNGFEHYRFYSLAEAIKELEESKEPGTTNYQLVVPPAFEDELDWITVVKEVIKGL